MSTSSPKRRAGFLLVPIVFSLAMTSRDPEPRAFPQFILIRGGGLPAPVLLYHQDLGRDAEGTVVDLRPSPIVRLYASAEPIEPPDAASLGARSYEVAEFWGPKWMELTGPDGAPTRPLAFEEATVFSTIFPDHPAGPLWRQSPLPGSQPSRRYLLISGWGREELETRGLSFGSGR